jgi:hypothetical protein
VAPAGAKTEHPIHGSHRETATHAIIVGVRGERGGMKAGRSVRTLMGRLERGINDLEFMRGEAVNSPSTTARFPGERHRRGVNEER